MKIRYGWTLIELLVVMAVIGVLMALIVPAVQHARAAARRAQCADNLRQLGIAFHNYHDNHGQLPPTYVAIRNSILPEFIGVSGPYDDANIHTYAEFLLPYIEQSSLYDEIDFRQPFFAPIDLTAIGLPNYTAPNQSIVSQPLAIFLCPAAPRPSNPHAETWSSLSIPITYMAGGNDYGPNNGISRAAPGGIADFAATETTDLHGALSNDFPNMRLEHLSDGTTHTALMWEIAGRPAMYQGKTPAGSTSGGGWADVMNAENWFKGSTADGKLSPGTCAINCTNRRQSGVYSFHSGGVQALLCDGSARFIDENLNVALFVRLVTYHGGEDATDF